MTGERERRQTEREAADRRYNETLTAVDAATTTPPERQPSTALELDLRDLREALPQEPSAAAAAIPGGWRGRLARFVLRTIAPLLERQRTFDAAAVAHLERTADALRRVDERLEHERQLRAHEAGTAATFHSALVQYLQQITPFVDTRLRVLEAALEDAQMAAVAAQRGAVAARRELERLGAAPASPAGAATTTAPAPAATAGAAAYVGFEDLFRGSPEAIRERQRADADRFAGASDVLDIGCGRGELLDLLRERGVSARGIDANPEMVEVCCARGLDAVHGDALAYLGTLPDGSLGGVIAAQVAEHLEPDYLVRLLDAAHAKLRPGAVIVLETINAAVRSRGHCAVRRGWSRV